MDFFSYTLFLICIMWSFSWTIYFDRTKAPETIKNYTIAYAPTIIFFLWFLIFV